MNTRTILAVAAALITFASKSLCAAPQTAVGYWASKITVNSWDMLRESSQTQTIAVGTSRADVLLLLGKPQTELARDTYSYDNCRADQFVAGDCKTLIVTFEQEQVSGLRFVNDAGMVLLTDSAKPSHAVAVAKN